MRLADAALPGGLAFTSAGQLSGLYAQLGDVEGAVRWAGRVAHYARRLYAEWFARHWYWEPVRSAPAFRAFLATVRASGAEP